MPDDDTGQRPPKADPRRGSLEPITDFEGKDEDTTAQFWSASRLARSDPKLKAAIDRLSAELVGEAPAPPPRDPAASMVPMDTDGLGGSLSRIYEEGRRGESSAGSDEVPRLPPLSAGREPGENTQPLPDVEDPTVAADDDPDDPPPAQARPKQPADRRPSPARPPPSDGQFDEVSHEPSREKTDPGGLGPVDEFTLSLSEDLVRAARGLPAAAAPAARRDPPSVPPEEAPRAPAPQKLAPPAARPRTPAPDPLTTGVVPGGDYGPLTTGVVANPEGGRTSDGTAALMLDGLDDLVLPASQGRADPRPSGQRGAASEESLRLPDVQMPPPDTQRAHKMAAPGRSREGEAPRGQREPEARAEPSHVRDPRPAASRPPAPSRPAARPPVEPLRAEPLRAEPRAEPRAGPPAPSTAAVKRLEELLTLAEEPPEREETISSSMELLSIADAPPEKEETIGAELVRVDGLQSVAEAPPAGEESVGGDLQRVDDSVDDLVLPPSVGTQAPSQVDDRRRASSQPPRGGRGGRPSAPPPQRPSDQPTLVDRGASPPTVPLPHRVPLADESTRPISAPPDLQRAPPKPLVSAQLRRETYRPAAAPPPQEAPRPAPQARREGAVPGLPPESGGGALQDSVLVWAGTFASLLIGGGVVLLLLLAIAYIVGGGAASETAPAPAGGAFDGPTASTSVQRIRPVSCISANSVTTPSTVTVSPV